MTRRHSHSLGHPLGKTGECWGILCKKRGTTTRPEKSFRRYFAINWWLMVCCLSIFNQSVVLNFVIRWIEPTCVILCLCMPKKWKVQDLRFYNVLHIVCYLWVRWHPMFDMIAIQKPPIHHHISYEPFKWIHQWLTLGYLGFPIECFLFGINPFLF